MGQPARATALAWWTGRRLTMSDTLQSLPASPAHTPNDNAPSVAHWDPSSFSLLSLLVPGAGQLAQGRFLAAAVQAATVGTYLAAAMSLGGGRSLWLAVAWNAWSAIDAYWHSP